jgi:hypothetical protein
MYPFRSQYSGAEAVAGTITAELILVGAPLMFSKSGTSELGVLPSSTIVAHASLAEVDTDDCAVVRMIAVVECCAVVCAVPVPAMLIATTVAMKTVIPTDRNRRA